MPAPGALDVEGLDIDPAVLTELITVDPERWRHELPQIEAHYGNIGERLPTALRDQLGALEKRLAD